MRRLLRRINAKISNHRGNSTVSCFQHELLDSHCKFANSYWLKTAASITFDKRNRKMRFSKSQSLKTHLSKTQRSTANTNMSSQETFITTHDVSSVTSTTSDSNNVFLSENSCSTLSQDDRTLLSEKETLTSRQHVVTAVTDQKTRKRKRAHAITSSSESSEILKNQVKFRELDRVIR